MNQVDYLKNRVDALEKKISNLHAQQQKSNMYFKECLLSQGVTLHQHAQDIKEHTDQIFIIHMNQDDDAHKIAEMDEKVVNMDGKVIEMNKKVDEIGQRVDNVVCDIESTTNECDIMKDDISFLVSEMDRFLEEHEVEIPDLDVYQETSITRCDSNTKFRESPQLRKSYDEDEEN